MKLRLLAFALPVALGLACAGGAARAEDLMQIYREAVANDPGIAAAKAQWLATQERVPIAFAGLLPSASLTGGVNANTYDATIKGDPPTDINRNRER